MDVPYQSSRIVRLRFIDLLEIKYSVLEEKYDVMVDWHRLIDTLYNAALIDPRIIAEALEINPDFQNVLMETVIDTGIDVDKFNNLMMNVKGRIQWLKDNVNDVGGVWYFEWNTEERYTRTIFQTLEEWHTAYLANISDTQLQLNVWTPITLPEESQE